MPVKNRTTTSAAPASWTGLLPIATTMGELFEHVPDTAFFVKDTEGRYRVVNQSLVERCGLRSNQELIGRGPQDIYPAELGERYAAQDRQLIKSGRPLIEKLELHWYPRRRTGWCLTTKLPLRDAHGKVIGLIGISRDLRAPRDASSIPAGLGTALEHLEKNYAESLSPLDLARQAGLSPVRFARLIKRIFRLTPSQLITQTRLAAASQLLTDTDEPISEIAQAVGFYDHSAFSRVFKAATGLTPLAFRQRGRAQI